MRAFLGLPDRVCSGSVVLVDPFHSMVFEDSARFDQICEGVGLFDKAKLMTLAGSFNPLGTVLR